MATRKFLITYNTGKQIVRCSTKAEAVKLAKQAKKLLGWVSFSVSEIKCGEA